MKACITVLIFCPILAVLAAGDSPPKEEAQQQATVTAHGIRIIGEGYQGEFTSGFKPGITVRLLVVIPQAGIIRLKREDCALNVFKDDRGTNLLFDVWEGPFGLRLSAALSADNHAASVGIESRSLPAPGATHITIAGTLCFDVGISKKTVTFDSLPMGAENKLKVGPITYTMTQKADKGAREMLEHQERNKMVVALEGPSNFLDIVEMKFFNDEGAEIPFHHFSHSLEGRGGDEIHGCQKTVLRELADPVTVQVTYWTERRDVLVPFNVKIMVGPDEPQPVEQEEPEPAMRGRE